MPKFGYQKNSIKSLGIFHIVVLIVVIALILLGYYIWNVILQKPRLSLSGDASGGISLILPTPTPFPFQEMTIPALKKRVYSSELADLEKLSENSSYTSYLTGYDSDGLMVNGLLTVPKAKSDKEKYPAIVFVHGYIPPQNYKTTVNYVSYVDYLAKNGFVVFKIDLRGHGDSEGEAGGGYYSDDYVVDTLNAVSALRSANFVDPKKIGLWGHSMAGNVVFRSFVAGSQIPAIVIWAGAGYTYSDLAEYMIRDTSYQPPPTGTQRSRDRQKLRDTYGSFDPENWFWKQIPATNYLDEVTGAVQINHAVDDNVVSIEYSRNLMNILDKTDIKHELNEYQSGGHNLTGSSFSLAMQKTVAFFKTNLIH